MKDRTATVTALASSVVEEAQEHSFALLFALNCLVWFAAGLAFAKVIL